MKLSFHGADRSVTGSCHGVECAGKTMLIDCGLDQGDPESAEVNAGDFGFDPASIDVLLLTHAHLDHCGRIPLLVKRGFRGEIIATAATRELARLVLLDSAHQQEQEAKSRAQSAERRGESAAAKEPLYGMLDALAAFDRFGRIAAYDQPIDLANGVAGHLRQRRPYPRLRQHVLDLAEDDQRRRVALFRRYRPDRPSAAERRRAS